MTQAKVPAQISGIEGTFKITCQHTMRVLRDNRESVIAVLEAFVHDPLVNWRLVAGARQVEAPSKTEGDKIPAGVKRPKADESHFADGKCMHALKQTVFANLALCAQERLWSKSMREL